MTPDSSVFDLPERLAAKRDPALIADDEAHFAAIAAALDASAADISARLGLLRRSEGGSGQGALERDLEIHRLSGRLRSLGRYGLDLCLGRIVGEEGTVYIGRFGLLGVSGPGAGGATDPTTRAGADAATAGEARLLLDWRAPAAAPFFAATHAHPLGLTSRRRYRWSRGRIVDYWDEVFTPGALAGHAALDDQSAFIASLGDSRSGRMRDVLATIQADQDAIVRAGSRGALVVDGGPGTGKTVVALHRTAYLLHADPRLGHRRGGVLFVGPNRSYLSYVADVLPSLGEEGVQTCTVRDLVAEGGAAEEEADAAVARIKESLQPDRVIEAAVARYEVPPERSLAVSTPWVEVEVQEADWAEAFAAAEPGVPHDEAREEVWNALLDILVEAQAGEAPPEPLRRRVQQDETLRRAFARAWPVLDPVGLVADLWSNPSFLESCAPELGVEEVALLQRAHPQDWTVADLPFLDAARLRIGEPSEVRASARRAAGLAAERERVARMVDDLVAAVDLEAADEYGEGLVTMLRGQDAQNSLIDESSLEVLDPDRLTGPFAHIVVDEAQELSDAEWRMLIARCPSRSFTIVGDRAQARHGFAESWAERLARVGLAEVTVATLGVNYRTPAEVMEVAEPVIRAVLPDANVPESVRRSGVPVEYGVVASLGEVLEEWLATHDDGVACVIAAEAADGTRLSVDAQRGAEAQSGGAHQPAGAQPRVSWLTPVLAKGLEFDLVVLLDPERFGDGVEGAVDRYVAMTRAPDRLVVLTGG